MVLFGVLIVLGVFGSGTLSDATAGGARDGLSSEHQRFLRFGEDTDLEVRLPAVAGTTTVSIDRDYLDDFEFGGVLPEPDAQSAKAGRLLLTFEGEAPSVVTVSLMPRTVGMRRARVSVNGGRVVSFRQLVYP